MPIDPSIALQAGQVGTFSLADIMLKAERAKGMRADRERAQWEWEQAQAEAERKGKARGSLADLILHQSPDMPGPGRYDPRPSDDGFQPGGAGSADRIRAMSGIPQSAEGAPANLLPEGVAAQPAEQQPNPWADYVRYDPEGAVDFRASTADWQKQEFDHARELNEGVLQILSGVSDQQSFDRAKNKARALYGRFGVRLDDFQLPDEYSPELVRSMQMEAMTTKDQLATLRAERKLDWDIEDDEIDNERLSEREERLAEDREARREQTRRAAERRDATTRRGQDKTDERVRGSATYQGRGRGSGYSGGSRPTATGPNGEKVEWNGKAWVPAK